MIASRVSSLGAASETNELGRDADTPFCGGSNLFQLTWQAREKERGGESGSKKAMSHPRPRLAGTCVFNNQRTSLN